MDLAEILGSIDPSLRDLFLVGLSRIYSDVSIIDGVRGDIFRAEGLIHFGYDFSRYVDYVRRVGSDIVDEYPHTVLICMDAMGLLDVLAGGIIDLGLGILDISAIVVSYLSSRGLFDTIYRPLLRLARRGANTFVRYVIGLDSITFRYSIHKPIKIALGTIMELFGGRKTPPFIKDCLASTLLAMYRMDGLWDEALYGKLMERISDFEKPTVFLPTLPLIAKNMYVVGNKELFDGIMTYILRVVGSKRRGRDRMLYLIIPHTTREFIGALKQQRLFGDLIMVFDTFARSENFTDDQYAVRYLLDLYNHTGNKTALICAMKFRVRTRPSEESEIIRMLLRKLSDTEVGCQESYELGSLYAYRMLSDDSRELLGSFMGSLKNRDVLRVFVLGLYEETLRMYPPEKNV